MNTHFRALILPPGNSSRFQKDDSDAPNRAASVSPAYTECFPPGRRCSIPNESGCHSPLWPSTLDSGLSNLVTLQRRPPPQIPEQVQSTENYGESLPRLKHA